MAICIKIDYIACQLKLPNMLCQHLVAFVFLTSFTSWSEVRSISPMTDVNLMQSLAAWVESPTKFPSELDAKSLNIITTDIYQKLVAWSKAEREENFNECIASLVDITVKFLKRDHQAELVVDSTGKLESGLLTGNIRWAGRYSECIGAHFQSFTTKWCIISLGGNQTGNVQLNTDGSLSVGICLPEPCSESVLHNALSSLAVGKNISIQAQCPVQPTVWTGTDIFSLIVLVTLIALVGIGTCADIFTSTADQLVGNVATENAIQLYGWKNWLIAFSISSNSRRLFSTDSNSDAIVCLHGMRFLSMAWVILGHTYAISLVYIDNIIDVAENLVSHITLQAVSNANFAVDTFFFLSGLLVAYLTLKRPHHLSLKQVSMAYIQRYIRLTPAYAFLILCVVGFIGKVGDGPRWPESYSEMHNSCEKYWWTNLLYINNLYPAALLDECYALGWYLANDMQFFLLAPISLYLLKRQPRVGLALLSFGIFSSMLVTGIISSHFELQPSSVTMAIALKKALHHSENTRNSTGLKFQPTSNAIPFWSDTYAKPWCRIGVYLIGMITGYIVREYKNRIRLSRAVCVLGFFLIMSVNMSLVYGLWWYVRNLTPLEINVAAFYDAMCRPIWAVTLGWIVIICVSGHGGPLNALLGWKVLIPLSRLTYCTYLVHPLIISIWFSTMETNVHYSDMQFAFFFLGILTSSLGLAYIVSMLVEIPFLNIGRLLLQNQKVQSRGHESLIPDQESGEHNHSVRKPPSLVNEDRDSST